MGSSLAELQRIGLKVFAGGDDWPRPRELIPIFHQWIQRGAIEGLPIDVADYEHVPEGPGVMLVAHEGNYALDLGDGRMGLLYYRKHPAPGDPGQRLRSLCRTVFHAARLLEEEPALGGRLRFRGDQIQLFANDRLLAPNSEETMVAFRPQLDELLALLYGGATCKVTRQPDPRERFQVNVEAPQPVAIEKLLARVG